MVESAAVVGLFKLLGTGVFFVTGVTLVSFSSFLLLLVAAFFLTVAGVVCSLVAAGALLERELWLEGGIGEEATELRDGRAEKLEDGRGELEFELLET